MEATCLASIQRTASGRVLNSTKANPREAPRKAGDSAQKHPTSVPLLHLCILNPFGKEDPRSFCSDALQESNHHFPSFLWLPSSLLSRLGFFRSF